MSITGLSVDSITPTNSPTLSKEPTTKRKFPWTGALRKIHVLAVFCNCVIYGENIAGCISRIISQL